MQFSSTAGVRAPLAAAAFAVLFLVVSCTRLGTDADTSGSAAAPASEIESVSFGDALAIAERYRVDGLDDRRVKYDNYWRVMQPAFQSAALAVTPVGTSIQGRELRAVTFGSGPTRVLLWSQMHGDETTASMSLADIFHYLADTEPDEARTRIAEALTVTFIPMLNPDGAERFQRHNAVGVDVNRDARNLQTPEGRTLKSVRDSINPDFGFNLHDQNARTRAGPTGRQVAIALLAPAIDESRAYNDVRSRARLVAATMADGLQQEIPGLLARYDDSFNPRAFGDLMQQWGTSTVLIEAGAMADDPQKQRLRTLNAAAILTALDAIATGSYRNANPQSYEDLPPNTGGASDLLITGAEVVLPGKQPMKVDIAVNYDDAVARTGGTVREVGDLEGVVAIDTVAIPGLYLHPERSALVGEGQRQWLTIGAPARFTVRRGADPASELVRRIDD